MASKKERNHFDLKEIENYCRTKTFPKRLAGKEEKANFRQTAKRFSIKNGQLYYKDSILVIADKDRQVGIIYGLGHGSGDTSYSKAMSSHLGKSPNIRKKLLHVSFGMGFTTRLQTAYKNVINVKDEKVFHLT